MPILCFGVEFQPAYVIDQECLRASNIKIFEKNSLLSSCTLILALSPLSLYFRILSFTK